MCVEKVSIVTMQIFSYVRLLFEFGLRSLLDLILRSLPCLSLRPRSEWRVPAKGTRRLSQCSIIIGWSNKCY